MLARLAPEPLPHVWWGVTIESDEQAGRADRLLLGHAGVEQVGHRAGEHQPGRSPARRERQPPRGAG
ncbi:hypothetical protein [Amycolatopsis sp. ATCC 39116]|uniref:hypothetical protein n=1 Tax=Amycolatopsis TaxID=1813 RepID=UPI0002626C9D|nr:hypothetical protein [Amycolatopsis sp. ATCC 39116]